MRLAVTTALDPDPAEREAVLNGDGRVDVVVTNDNATLTVFLNTCL
jgi:hypothetical protein